MDPSGDEGERRREPSQQRITLNYSGHVLHPEDLLDFIELPVFTKRWAALDLNDDEDLSALQLFIMAGPKRPKTIRGTEGIRKIRFAPKKWKTGKSGAARVLYVYFEAYGLVLLCLAYGKNEVSNISDAVKSHLNKLVREIEKELRRRFADK